MIRAGVIGVLGLVLLAGPATGQGLPPLPKWSPSDFEKLQKGELIPGSDFFIEQELPMLPVVPPEELEPTEPIEEFPTTIEDRFHSEYFVVRPKPLLVDPQELLSRQEYRDRESFLAYHAGESVIDLYIYLFDAKQELPEGVTIDSVFAQHFEGSGPTAVVFYYLGMPERSQLVLSQEIRAVASEEEHQRALRKAVQEAFEKSDPAYQLDSFLVELSIRLYWFEKAMSEGELPTVSAAEGGDLAGAQTEVPGASPGMNRTITNVLIGVVFLVTVGGLGWIGRIFADRKIRYEFPEVDSGTLLGAPHAAGVGAVVSFRSAQLPAAQQRDQVPDYIQRM